MRALVAQGNGAWIGFERLLDVVSQRRGEVEIDKGFVVNVAHVGDGQHLGYPEGKQDLGPALEGLAGLVIEVAELGDVELECAWYFLLGAGLSAWRPWRMGGVSGASNTSASVRIESIS